MKNLVHWVCFICVWSISIFISSFIFLFPLNNIKWVLLIFKDSLLAFSQDEIYIISIFSSFCIVSMLFPSMNIFESSANINGNTLFETLGRSFIQIKKSNGQFLQPTFWKWSPGGHVSPNSQAFVLICYKTSIRVKTVSFDKCKALCTVVYQLIWYHEGFFGQN